MLWRCVRFCLEVCISCTQMELKWNQMKIKGVRKAKFRQTQSVARHRQQNTRRSKSTNYNYTIVLPTISMLINTGLANKLQKSCMWRFHQLTTAPRLASQGLATDVSFLSEAEWRVWRSSKAGHWQEEKGKSVSLNKLCWATPEQAKTDEAKPASRS